MTEWLVRKGFSTFLRDLEAEGDDDLDFVYFPWPKGGIPGMSTHEDSGYRWAISRRLDKWDARYKLHIPRHEGVSFCGVELDTTWAHGGERCRSCERVRTVEAEERALQPR